METHADMLHNYTDAVRYLKSNPDQILPAFCKPFEHPAGCLFLCASPDGHFHILKPEVPGQRPVHVGCPVLVSAGTHVCWSKPGLRKILAARLPTSPRTLAPQHLESLANVQIHLDLTLRDRKWRDEHRSALLAPWQWDYVEDLEI